MSETKKQIFLWFGANDFEIHEKINGWTGAFEKKFGNLNVVSFDATDAKNKEGLLRDMKNAFQVNSLFGENKLILFRDFLTAKAKIGKEVEDLIYNFFGKISATFFVIFYQTDAPDKRTKLYKAFVDLDKKGIAEVKEYNLPQGNELTRWITERAKKYSASLDQNALASLAFMSQGDLWQIDRELHKLSCYKPAVMITAADVAALVKGKYNDDIFALMDAISAKDKKKALFFMREQLDSGANEIYLLTMLIRQFRILWQVKEASDAHPAPPDVLARELGIHPFVVRKTVAYLRFFTRADLKRIYNQLLEFDRKMKTSSADFELLFDLILVGLS